AGRQVDQYLHRAIERQTGGEQGAQLARDGGDVLGADAAFAKKPRQRAFFARAGRHAGERQVDAQRQQPQVAQTLDHGGFLRRFEFSMGDFARGADGFVTIQRHGKNPGYDSRVTRSTSSNVVTPCTTLRKPWSYMGSMPSA